MDLSNFLSAPRETMIMGDGGLVGNMMSQTGQVGLKL